ncbi:MAG TPA: hypothetical protein VFI37_15970 [Gaiellaceae bacterium]|jgi:hypothetical protein|nr:hypothetical protein [Gaiellaceae bacterium]
MASKREAVIEDLRAVGDDLQSLFESIVQDPKERQRRERRWRILYGGLGAVATLVARRSATKAYGILTGEGPPARRGAPRK